MSYCRWHDGHLYAYEGADGFHVHVTGPAVVSDIVKDHYLEPSASALLARILWLRSKGCETSWDTFRFLMEDVVAEVEEAEGETT
jgi:hypothetical protein